MERSPENPLETKADPLEASFDAVLIAEETQQHGQAIAALRGDVDGLKGQVDAIGKIAARPALDGAKAMPSSPASQDFVARYLRRGEQAGVELKSFSGASGPEGGFAVPQEIDALIGATLKDISPIRSIATVVQTGTAGYRKLVTTGGGPIRRISTKSRRPPASFMPIRRRRRRCWMMRRSMWRPGWPTRSRGSLPGRRVLRSSADPRSL